MSRETAHAQRTAEAEVQGDTWTGKATVAEPVAPTPGGDLSVQDRIALSDQESKVKQAEAEQRQRHRLQFWAAAGAAGFVLIAYTLTLSFASAHVLDPSTVADVIHTILAPMVVSGLIAIIAWLFGSRAS